MPTDRDESLAEAKREIAEGWAKNEFRSVAEIRLAKAIEALIAMQEARSLPNEVFGKKVSGGMTAKERVAKLMVCNSVNSLWALQEIIEGEIQEAADEALERASQAALCCHPHTVPGHELLDECHEYIAREIRALKSQPQPLPPLVTHDPAIRDSMRAIPEQPPYLPSTMKNEYDR